MATLPYANSTADPMRAQGRIRVTLQKFGVDRISFVEDFVGCEIAVQFVYNGYPVKLPVNYRKLADRLIEDDPWTSRKRKSVQDWNGEKREVAYRASFSVLEDFLKAAITLVETGLFGFEEVFIGHFINRQGVRLGELMAPRLQEFVSGKLALGE